MTKENKIIIMVSAKDGRGAIKAVEMSLYWGGK